jgi:dethiobiotin synthetase
MNQRFFVTGTGTGVGKSFITAGLVRQAKAVWRSVSAHKPVVTGFNPANANDSDTGFLLQCLDRELTEENIQRMSPWRFAAPLAPVMAARQEDRDVDFDALVIHTRGTLLAPDDLVLIEGVGGIMVPLTKRHTVLDWIEPLEIPVVLVTGSYLGTLSHTLTTLEVLKQRQIPIHAIVVNESEESTVSLDDTIEELRRWTDLPLVPVTRRRVGDDAENIKELRALLA